MSSFTFFQILFFMFFLRGDGGVGGGGDGCTLNLVTKHHDHWTLHHVGTADKSHIKNDNNDFWTMCVTHKAKWMGTASTLTSSKIIQRDVLMMMKWRPNEKQTAPFHPDGLTGALTETPGADWPEQ